MTWRVEIDDRAERELEDLPLQVQVRLINKILSLKENPLPPGCAKLKGHTGYRVRVGDYRILYELIAKSELAIIYAVGHRKDIYR
jgi:mRNA interferase RelE/StbE